MDIFALGGLSAIGSQAVSSTYASTQAQSNRTAGQKSPNATPPGALPGEDADSVQISVEGQARSQQASGPGQLSEEEQQQLKELQARDREVRAHEQAHRSAGGQYVRGAINYTYQRGPDGQLYAVGGEVSIDTSAIPNDPEATARKMEQVRRAALAPSNPSPQDRQVTAEAARRAAQAQAESLRDSGETENALSTSPLEQFQAEPVDDETAQPANPFSALYERNSESFVLPGSVFELVA